MAIRSPRGGIPHDITTLLLSLGTTFSGQDQAVPYLYLSSRFSEQYTINEAKKIYTIFQMIVLSYGHLLISLVCGPPVAHLVVLAAHLPPISSSPQGHHGSREEVGGFCFDSLSSDEAVVSAPVSCISSWFLVVLVSSDASTILLVTGYNTPQLVYLP